MVNWFCAGGVEVPATEHDARAAGWRPAGSGKRLKAAPVWDKQGRCEGDEVCLVYAYGAVTVAVYCSQRQCVVELEGPFRACTM
jgi:hypothetical protein